MQIRSFLFNKNNNSPTEAELRRWAGSEWIEYQAWLFHHDFLTLHDWQALRRQALRRKPPAVPWFSVVTPVYNTEPAYLRECIGSVLAQAYPHWEMCLVDDGSSRPETLEALRALCATDRRLRLTTLAANEGICAATNRALAMARGDYTAFLDHDDRLAPDALFRVAEFLRDAPDTDVLYSDRDMLSPDNLRFMHLFKPDWSPETLLAGNYLFHLLVYRRTLVQQLGGLREDFEGSQDYDLILRAADSGARVRHLAGVLYHWRQHPQSVSLAHDSKAYAYQAGVRALQESLQRRGLRGTVEENRDLWRGNYRVRLQAPDRYRLVSLERWDDYAEVLRRAASTCAWLVVLGPGVRPLADDSLMELASWLQVPEVIAVTGKVVDAGQKLLHAGLVMRPGDVPLSVYREHPQSTPGYMAVTASLRNVSLPHPACCALKSAWLGEALDDNFTGPYALLDAILKTRAADRRVVYNPHAGFLADQGWLWPEQWPEGGHFREHWRTAPGDPYYNPYLTTRLADMGLDMDKWRATESESRA